MNEFNNRESKIVSEMQDEKNIPMISTINYDKKQADYNKFIRTAWSIFGLAALLIGFINDFAGIKSLLSPQSSPELKIYANIAENRQKSCLQFALRSNETIEVVSVAITEPILNRISNFNPNKKLVIPQEFIALQPESICFLKIFGRYKFDLELIRPGKEGLIKTSVEYLITN
jgi:hypothetical protein